MRLPYLPLCFALLLAFSLTACQQIREHHMGQAAGGSGPIRDEHLKAEQILATASLDTVGGDLKIEGITGPWYSEALQAWARWPSEAEIGDRTINFFESPERTSQLDIPELCLLMGALQRGGYTELPVETYVDVLLLRLFAHEVTFFPDPSQEDPTGFPIAELLTDAQSAMAPALLPALRTRLNKVIGSNPKAFTPRESGWALRLIEGETGQLKTSPEEMYHRLCLAVITHDLQQLRPAFDAAAKDRTNVAPFRFSSIMASYLMADDPETAGVVFAERIFGDNYLPEVYSYEAYRLLASQQDPACYDAIHTALEKLPAAQHVDYAEFLARYGKPEDLATVERLIDTPIDAVDQRLTCARSLRLLDPPSRDLNAATQTPEALAMRDSIAGAIKGDDTNAQSDTRLLPSAITTDPKQAKSLAEELRVPLSQLHPHELTPSAIKAQRLWWLRFYAPDLVRARLERTLARGSEIEQLTALRMLGLYGGSQALPSIARGFKARSQAVKTEAALWYLTSWHRYLREQDPAPIDTAAEPPIPATN